ncbi:LysR family transcriptional regulator [Pseudidiomarina halophila]|uniref:LysR family transcriptional regulator n=1 Tax=Pseudidiomarina halophila TaxID=1449799 RepID=A0A432XTA0_9GAMM|nr:LysR family transcriptional regulator [Pseudidiomarina halophila]RUO51942.1 LysR family transcriptional regulator [Pseudidiomarina halophila]
MDRLQAMKVFVTVVNEGSFVQAAEKLGLSPQLVSKSLSQLEEHLGVRLLNRTTRRQHLTEAGTAYYQRAQQVLADIDDLELQLSGLQHSARGVLRISAPVSFAIRHLAPLVCAFQEAYPQVVVDLQLNDRKVDIIEEGFDIALRIGKLDSSSLIAKRLAPVRLLYCAAPGYLERAGTPADMNALREHRYLHYSYMNDAVVPTARKVLLSNNGDILVEAACAGAGIALQPTFIAWDALREGRLQPILRAYEPEPIALYAVFAHRQFLASKVRSFLDFIDGYFGTPPYWDNF